MKTAHSEVSAWSVGRCRRRMLVTLRSGSRGTRLTREAQEPFALAVVSFVSGCSCQEADVKRREASATEVVAVAQSGNYVLSTCDRKEAQLTCATGLLLRACQGGMKSRGCTLS